jgi:hypothetical protein
MNKKEYLVNNTELPKNAYLLEDDSISYELSPNSTPITIINGHKEDKIKRGFILDTDDIMILIDENNHKNALTALVYSVQSMVLKKLLR